MAQKSLMVEALEAMEVTRSSMAYMEAVRILHSSKTNAGDVAKAIQFDPKLADHVLNEVNSPFFGIQHKVEKLDQAIALLGFDRIEQLLQKTISHEMYAQVEKSYTEMMSFKRHGLAVACLAEQLAECLKVDNPEEIFQAGMMHDIGKFLYLSKFAQHFQRIIKEMRETGTPMYLLERKYFGTDHSEMGEMMAEAWGLPDSVRVAARYHHEISDKDRDRLTTRETIVVELVTYANLLAHGRRFGGAKGNELPPPPVILTEDDVNSAVVLAQTKYEELARDMGFS